MQNKSLPTNQKDSLNHQPLEAETASELAHRHLEDESHETTEEEIRNVTLELGEEDSITTDYENSVEKNAEENEANRDDDDDEKDIITTPASVLGS